MLRFSFHSKLSHFYKHSESADLLRKSLLPHAYACHKVILFPVQAQSQKDFRHLLHSLYHLKVSQSNKTLKQKMCINTNESCIRYACLVQYIQRMRGENINDRGYSVRIHINYRTGGIKMDVYTTDRIRNVVLLGHGGCGKTSLAEAMAYLS